MNKPTAIIISDLHLRDDQPTCRTDDFWKTQIRKLKWVNDEWKRLECPTILCAGDVFHKAKPSPKLLSMAIRHLPGLDPEHENYYLYVVPGNHDLPNHNLAQLSISGLQTLKEAGNLFIMNEKQTVMPCVRITPFPFGATPKKVEENKEDKRRYVALVHLYIYKGEKPWKDCESPSCSKVLSSFKGYDLVITGDNHQSFIYKDKKDRLLINPGCMSRQNLNEIDYEPSIYLWYAKQNEVERLKIPIEKNVFSKEHIKSKKEQEARENAFVETLSENYDIELSFEKNMQRFFESNPNIEDKVIQKVWDTIKGEE